MTPLETLFNIYLQILEEKETLEQHVLKAAAPAEILRFLFVAQTEPAADGGKDESSSSSMTPGEKACIENVRVCLDDGAIIVASAMLEATGSAEKKVKTENSVPLSLNSIYEEVIKSEEGRNITFDRVRASLVQLSCPPFVKAVNFKKIIELAQNDEVESIVLKRYGRDAYRIFRLLLNTVAYLRLIRLQISHLLKRAHQKSFISCGRMIICILRARHMVCKLQLTGVRQSQFFLWKVNKNTLREHVLDKMFHAALNLIQRVDYELEQEKRGVAAISLRNGRMCC
ncbi:hypothetical protein CRYUN_Cryun12cG0093000 [Craigia yunnanensis]